jgi:hypothetical protein
MEEEEEDDDKSKVTVEWVEHQRCIREVSN